MIPKNKQAAITETLRKPIKLLTEERYTLTHYVKNKMLLIAAGVAALVGFLIAVLYYFQIIATDRISCYFWIASMVLMFLSLCEKISFSSVKAYFFAIPLKFWAFAVGITAVYFISHCMNYHTAPWNNYGLFDDAAWDIFLSKIYCFSDHSFQIIFADMDIGGISRELFFHYYITIFFKLFGYNLFVFNVSLILLGYISVLFIGLIGRRLFKSDLLGALAALLINFYPLHFTQVFMGHRYAICVPLMVISVYCLIVAYKDNKPTSAALGGFFAAFCMSSAIMGKHFVYGLIATALVYAVFNFKKEKNFNKLFLTLIVVIAFVMALLPLLAYLSKHSDFYMQRENSLIKDFMDRVKIEGLAPIKENLGCFWDVLTKPHIKYRQFSRPYPALPYAYLILVIPGAVIAFVKKNYLLPLMILINFAGNIVATTYDFRLLLVSPFYILSIVYVLYLLAAKLIQNRKKPNWAYSVAALICGLSIAVGLVPMVIYLNKASKDPTHINHLNHANIAAVRIMQDIAIAAESPSSRMKADEFNPVSEADPNYDILAGPHFAFAPAHLYMQNFDEKKVLAFDRFPYQHKAKGEIRSLFLLDMIRYVPQEKGLKIVLEVGDEILFLIEWLEAQGLGTSGYIRETLEGREISVFIYTIENNNIEAFKQRVVDWN